MTQPNLDQLVTELTALADSFREMRTQIGAGESVDLTGLDQRVEDLCNRVVEAPPENRKELVPRLQNLVSDLDGLEKTIREKQEALMRHQAKGAYPAGEK